MEPQGCLHNIKGLSLLLNNTPKLTNHINAHKHTHINMHEHGQWACECIYLYTLT